MFGGVDWDVNKIQLLDCVVLKKENMVFGDEEARWLIMVRSGAAWVEKGNARTATWGLISCTITGRLDFVREWLSLCRQRL
ncbi:hypothetical protein V6N13_148493 [Hibiscus sabdariffa]